MNDKHPHAIAWDEFKAKNAILFDAGTLGRTDPDKYLLNRLWTAFMAGIAVGGVPANQNEPEG